MRILFVADDLYPGFGGQARATEGHVAALVARGHQVVAVAGSEPEPSEPPPGVRVVRLPSFRLGKAQTRFAVPVASRIAAEVAWADVVHVNTPTPLAKVTAALARRRGVPLVMGVHTQIETSTLQVPVLGPLLAPLLRAWYGYVYSQADLLTAPTTFARDMACTFADVRGEVVSNGIDFQRWSTPPVAAAASDGVHRLAYVGRLSNEKRPQDLLPLMARLGEGYQLSIAGTGPLEDEMRRRIAAAGLGACVRLLGYVPEDAKRALLAQAEVFVMPSPAELQSIATLEAMAMGCAVAAVGHASSAVPGFVQASGAGIVLPVDDVEGQAAALRAFLEGDATRLRQARERATAYAATHDMRLVAAQLERLYLDLMQASATRPWRAAA